MFTEHFELFPSTQKFNFFLVVGHPTAVACSTSLSQKVRLVSINFIVKNVYIIEMNILAESN